MTARRSEPNISGAATMLNAITGKRWRPADPEKAKREFLVKLQGESKPKKSRERRTPAKFVKAGAYEYEGGLWLRLPIHTVNESNHRECWAAKDKRRAGQRSAVGLALGVHPRLMGERFAIQLTRWGIGRLDAHDGLPRSMKAIADEVAAWLGIDDGDERLTWSYAQNVGWVYGVDIRIEVR
jgi:hypothetical protein